MNAGGADFTLFSGECGTGMDAYFLGMPDAAQALLDKEIERINALNPKRVVTLSLDDLRVLTGGVPGLDASALSVPVTGFSAYILELIKNDRLVLNNAFRIAKEIVAFHDGDQGGRFLQDFETPREVLKLVPGVEYKELFWSKGEAASAGESGLIRLLDPSLAEKIARKRMEQIEGRGIDILVTDSPEAKAQLAAVAFEGLQVLHIAEFLMSRTYC